MLDFHYILKTHKENYPLMKPVDYAKLCYQSEFGPRHLGLEYDKAFYWISKEWNEAGKENFHDALEPIGNGLFRCHFWKDADEDTKELFTELFLLTGSEQNGTVEGLKERLKMAEKFDISGMTEWLSAYEKEGYPAVSHSEEYRNAYAPHYRLVREEYMRWFPLLLAIRKLMKKKGQILISIDGNCGSGKTTFADVAKKIFGANVFHMDDYYLPMAEREENWSKIPAGNMNLLRFKEEVLIPAKEGRTVKYQPYHCQSRTLKEAVFVEPANLTIVEGSYSQHPLLAGFYDWKVFLTCKKEEQEKRLIEREGDYFSVFQSTWIPMEENYHSTYQIKEKADERYETGER